jgi:outer membrane receptor protein involved in Fe transport
MSRQDSGGAWIALCLAVCFAPAARAAEFDEFADDPSAFSTVIEARDYDDRFATVEDVLRDAPGVHVRRFGGLGAYSTAGIRGSKPEQVLVLLDGVRLNSSGRGAVDLSTLPLRLVERIEVVRGGGAGRYGSDAVGGVVSITSRRPDDEPTLDADGLSGEYGTLGLDALASGGRGAHAGLVGYSRLRAENDFRFDRSFERVNLPSFLRLPTERFTRRNAELSQQTGLLRWIGDVGETSDLAATLQLHGSDRGQPGSIYRSAQPGVSDEQVSCPRPEEDFRRVVGSVDFGNGALGPGALGLSAFHRTEESGLHDPDGACGLVVPSVRDGSDRIESTDAQTGAEATYATRWFGLGPLSLRTRASAGLRRDHLRGDDTPSAESWVTNAFALEELRLLGGRLRVFPSVGLEIAHTGSVETRIPGLGAPTEIDSDDSAEWIPKLGAIATLAPGLRLKANVGRAFRRPNFGELFLPDFGYVRGNPNLEPEDARNFDVGVELAPPDFGPVSAISLEVVRFDSDIEQGIEFVQVNAFSVQPVNTGESRVRGWELGGALTLFDHLDLSGSYTFQDTKIESPGPRVPLQPWDPPLPHRPRNQLSARARVRAGAGAAWIETHFEDENSLSETGRIAADASWQADLGVSVALSELPGLRFLPSGLELSTEWVNVGETQQIDSLGFPLPGRLWYLRLRSQTRFGPASD